MFSKASWKCPKCGTTNPATALQAGQVARCSGCPCTVRLKESLFKPDLSNFLNATAFGLLTDLGELVSEEDRSEAFRRMLPVLRYALAESEARGRQAARRGLRIVASN
jgi:uncharacterized membrane protein